jgi:hypothetical protein
MTHGNGRYAWKDIFQRVGVQFLNRRNAGGSTKYVRLYNIAACLYHNAPDDGGKVDPGMGAIDAMLEQIAAIRADLPDPDSAQSFAEDGLFLRMLEEEVVQKREEMRARTAENARHRREVKRMMRRFDPPHCQSCGMPMPDKRQGAKFCSSGCRQKNARLKGTTHPPP